MCILCLSFPNQPRDQEALEKSSWSPFFFIYSDQPYLTLSTQNYQEPQNLTGTVPNLINAKRALSTKWTAFCNNFGIIPITADPFKIVVYFNYLLSNQGTRGAITDAMFGIRCGHFRLGYLPPTDHPYINLANDGAVRLANYSCSKKNKSPSLPICCTP